jgi:hypothetical protein
MDGRIVLQATRTVAKFRDDGSITMVTWERARYSCRVADGLRGGFRTLSAKLALATSADFLQLDAKTAVVSGWQKMAGDARNTP